MSGYAWDNVCASSQNKYEVIKVFSNNKITFRISCTLKGVHSTGGLYKGADDVIYILEHFVHMLSECPQC